MSTTLLIQGWRFVPHSYAVINQSQIAALSGRAALTMYHEDLPLYQPSWRVDPQSVDDRVRDIVAALVPPPPLTTPDYVYRIAYPFDLTPDPRAARTCVYVTEEFGRFVPSRANRALTEIAQTPELTLITPSEYSRSALLASGAPSSQVVVIPNGFDPAIFFPVDAASRANLRATLDWTDHTVIFHNSALTGNKGIPILLAACAELLDEFPNLRLVLKGNDALYPSQTLLQRYLAEMSPASAARLQSHIHYFGSAIDPQTLAILYQAADLYVAPYHAEAFNLPVLEAAACGLPVVCTGGGPTDEFTVDAFAKRIASRIETVRDAEGEKIVLMPDLAACTDAIRQSLRDADWRARACEHAPLHVHARYTWDRIATMLMHTFTR